MLFKSFQGGAMKLLILVDTHLKILQRNKNKINIRKVTTVHFGKLLVIITTTNCISL